jgi:hypothetical protein
VTHFGPREARWAVTLYRKRDVVPLQHSWRVLMGERHVAFHVR